MGVSRQPSDFATFSNAVAVDGPGKWIYVSGQVAMGDDGRVIDGSVAEQTEAILDRIEELLSHDGATLSHVVKITTYLKSLDEYSEFSRVRGERFGDTLPASAAYAVADLLVGAAVEIEAVAFVPQD